MQGWKELKISTENETLEKKPHLILLPLPGSSGILSSLVALLALLAGLIRNELVLTLLGTVFLSVILYCFIALTILGLIHRRKSLAINTEIITKQIKTGGQGELYFPQARFFFKFPGTIIRYEIKLMTKDGRIINLIINPEKIENGCVKFPVPERGAYYNTFEKLLFIDMAGFFYIKLPAKKESVLKLLAIPAEAEESIALQIRSGGSEKRSNITYKKTDILTESRPYVPGDDPRRINWKLYSHGPGSELYVREGENSPPPHSRLLILLDTQIDPALFNTAESRNAVDLLCKSALKITNELGQKGIEVTLGYTGGKITNADASALAMPYALPFLSNEALPDALDNAGLLILAAPRLSSGNTALDNSLDRFISQYPDKQLDLHFYYAADIKDAEEAAKSCTTFYRRKKNVLVRCYAMKPYL